ncbi:MAG: mechanosensitive ion channel [Sedimentisphaerales bacterium]|nr:mechanosensitive ion channel [Sedimentisphaerales bacterium]
MWGLIVNWKITIGVVGVPLLLGFIGHFLVYRIIRKFTRDSKNKIDDSIVRHCYRPFQWVVVFLVIRIGTVAALPEGVVKDLNHLLGLILITCISWLLIKSVYVLEDYIVRQFEVNVKDNLKARKIHTQFRVLKRIVIITVCIISLALILMTFPKIRALGTTILASAGIIGIVIGFAAQKTISTFIAGLQIAFTQPIRVDDVVIVENEWGRIEEITLTYVVVRIWDLRRLIVPITYFIEKPFQNWTRVTADILGTVFLYVDYTVPFDSIRKELQRILNNSELWDKKVCVLQVTNSTERSIELRALMSASDASAAWSLRCEVREKLIDFIQKKYPKALPKLRAEMDPPKPAGRTVKKKKA